MLAACARTRRRRHLTPRSSLLPPRGSNFRTVPLLSRIVGRTCHFSDGSSADVDAIILCTGYQHHFPFLDPSLRLSTANRLWIDTLHGALPKAHPLCDAWRRAPL